MNTKLKNGIKKEIKKQVSIKNSHLGTVIKALSVQFPSVNLEIWEDFIIKEFCKRYANI